MCVFFSVIDKPPTRPHTPAAGSGPPVPVDYDVFALTSIDYDSVVFQMPEGEKKPTKQDIEYFQKARVDAVEMVVCIVVKDNTLPMYVYIAVRIGFIYFTVSMYVRGLVLIFGSVIYIGKTAQRQCIQRRHW